MDNKIKVESGEYKGHQVLIFTDDKDRIVFSIGLFKLQIIYDNIEVVKNFIRKNGGDVNE